jgi:hypothetical protein
MKKVYFITFIVVLQILVQNFNNLFAQELYLGARAGLSIPSLQGGNSEQSKGYKSRLAPDLGLMTTMEFKNRLALQLDVSYIGQGGVKKGIQAIPPDKYPAPVPITLYADFKTVAILNYIEVPLLIKYYFTVQDLFKIYVDVGPNFGFLVEAKTKTSGSGQIYADKNGTPLVDQNGNVLPSVNFSSTTDIKNDINSVNYGITGGVGIVRDFGTGELILDGRASYGLSTIQKDPDKNGNNHTGCLVITLGYATKLRLGKK